MVSIEVEEIYVVEPPPRIGWGWYLAAGIAWIVLGLSILSLNPVSIALIAYAVATVLIIASAYEFFNVVVSPGWKWLHAIAGVLFLAAGVLTFTEPFQSFAGLAILFGWYLLIEGMVIFIVSIAMRGPGSLWGLGVAIGSLYFLIGLWAIGYPARSAWLLVLWVGIGAVLHGIWDIVRAFQYRSVR